MHLRGYIANHNIISMLFVISIADKQFGHWLLVHIVSKITEVSCQHYFPLLSGAALFFLDIMYYLDLLARSWSWTHGSLWFSSFLAELNPTVDNMLSLPRAWPPLLLTADFPYLRWLHYHPFYPWRFSAFVIIHAQLASLFEVLHYV